MVYCKTFVVCIVSSRAIQHSFEVEDVLFRTLEYMDG